MNILLKELIEQKDIPYHSIVDRVKDKDSLDKKIETKNKYENLDEITDIVGCRIITYFEDDVEKIVQLIDSEFSIDTENSIDKKKMLDPEKFGYISYHIVCSINTQRAELIEYKNYKKIKFEIQIRTILQHAWAEIEHDIGYKATIQVPSDFRRKFSRLAGMLEIVDDEFTRLKNDIEDYVRDISDKGLGDTDINAESMKIFMGQSKVISEISKYINNEFNFIEFEPTDEEYDYVINSLIEHINKYTKFQTVNELERAITESKEKIKKFIKMWLNTNPETITYLKQSGPIYSFMTIHYYILTSLLQLQDIEKLMTIMNKSVNTESEEDVKKKVDLALDIYKKL